jgi:hypothetical protein
MSLDFAQSCKSHTLSAYSGNLLFLASAANRELEAASWLCAWKFWPFGGDA